MRFRVALKCFIPKQKLKEELMKGSNFKNYHSIGLPLYSKPLPAAVVKGNQRYHPYLDITLNCPAIIVSKRLLENNAFAAGG